MSNWKFKLPLLVALINLVLAIPFLAGWTEPGLHGGGGSLGHNRLIKIYTGIHFLLNLPPIVMFGWLMEIVTMSLFPGSSLRTSNLMAIAGCSVFWCVFAGIPKPDIDTGAAGGRWLWDPLSPSNPQNV